MPSHVEPFGDHWRDTLSGTGALHAGDTISWKGRGWKFYPADPLPVTPRPSADLLSGTCELAVVVPKAGKLRLDVRDREQCISVESDAVGILIAYVRALHNERDPYLDQDGVRAQISAFAGETARPELRLIRHRVASDDRSTLRRALKNKEVANTQSLWSAGSGRGCRMKLTIPRERVRISVED
jgi:hypothetical protein